MRPTSMHTTCKRLNLWRLAAFLIAAINLAACALPGPQPAAGVTVTDAGDAVITSEQRGGVLILDVQSAQGIGSAHISLAEDLAKEVLKEEDDDLGKHGALGDLACSAGVF